MYGFSDHLKGMPRTEFSALLHGSIRYSGRTFTPSSRLADNGAVRSLAVVLASVFVVGSGLAALYMVFAAWFPYENLSSDELREDDWLALAALAVLGLAVATLIFVVKRRPLWAGLSLVAEAAIGLLALRFALIELSDRSDTELILFVCSIGLVGLCAVIVSYASEANT